MGRRRLGRKSVLNLVRWNPRPKQVNRQTLIELRGVAKEVGDDAVALYNEIVSDWSTVDVSFESQTGVGGKQFFVRVVPKGSEEDKTIFYSIDRGTKKRKIVPSSSPFLQFVYGGKNSYQGRTTPTPTWGNTVSISNPTLIRTEEVKDHAIEARAFDRVLEPELMRESEGAIRNAIRRVKRKLKLR